MDSIDTRAKRLHQRWRGKLAVRCKFPIRTRTDLSLAYTPGVAEISRAVYRNPSLARIYTIKGNSVAVVTDGSAVLGLGNLGALAALPVMEGKCMLFQQLAGIDAFPICLDTQDVDETIQTIKRIAPVFGGINLEDIAAPRCFEIERQLKQELDIPVVHDDQHGTAVVVLAALINALKLKKLLIQQSRIVILGAGAAGTAIAKLLLEYGARHIIVCDREGILNRKNKRLTGHKAELAKLTNQELRAGDVARAMQGADVFIGVSAKNIANPAMVKGMNPRPIIFAMANPDPEILPSVAKKAGAFIVASGRSDFPNQVNNVLGFPGIFRGALDHGVKTITSTMLIAAAKKLTACLACPSPERILPDPLDKRVVKAVASAIRN